MTSAHRANPIPNILTGLRLAAGVVMFAMMAGAAPGALEAWLSPETQGRFSVWAFWIFVIAASTDWVDGYLARRWNATTRWGAILDPIADKIMVAAVVLMLVFTRDINGWHTIAALVILLREITVSGLREFLAGLQVSVPVSQLAKWKTGFQMISLGALILAGGLPQFPIVQTVGLWTLWAAAILTLVTGWDYLRVGLKHMD